MYPSSWLHYGKPPGLMNFIEAGAGSDAMVLSMLASQAEIVGGRMRLQQKKK